MTLGDARGTRWSDGKVEKMYLYLFLHILHTGLTCFDHKIGSSCRTKQQFQGICCKNKSGGTPVNG